MAERTLVTRWKSVVDSSVNNAADTAEKAAGKAHGAWTAVGTAVGGFLSEGLSRMGENAIEFAKDSFRAASDLKESVNVTSLVFKDNASKMDAFFKSAAANVGMSETAAREAASGVGGLLQNMGLGKKETMDWSKKLLVLAADMGSAFNADPADAIEAIGAGLRGESEPLRRYNVMLSDAAMKQEAMNLGLYKGKGQLSNAAKAQAALALIMKQTNAVHGDFKNTSTGAANAARIQAAKIEDLKAKVANSLLPVQEAWLNLVNNQLLPAMVGLTDGIETGTAWVKTHGEELKTWAIALGIVAGAIGLVAIQQQIVTAGGFLKWISAMVTSTKVWTGVQALFNVVMSANPIGIVIVAIAALVAGIIVAYQQSETFRNIVNGAFSAIADAGKWLWNNGLQPVVKWIVEGFAWVVDGIAGFLEMLGNIPGFEWARDAGAKMRGLARDSRAAAEGIQKIPDAKTLTLRDQATEKVKKIDNALAGLKDKLVTAKANGDASEVKKLQKAIDDLKDKKVKIEAEVKKGTIIARTQMKAGKDGTMKFTALARGGIIDQAGRIRRFANGGFEDHRAQIAPAGAYRLWAEEETGGEGYIPLSPAKRSTSVPVWWEVGRRLGLVRYANGGIDARQSAAVAPGSIDDVLQQLVRLLARLATREDLQAMINALRQAPAGPRAVGRLG